MGVITGRDEGHGLPAPSPSLSPFSCTRFGKKKPEGFFGLKMRRQEAFFLLPLLR